MLVYRGVQHIDAIAPDPHENVAISWHPYEFKCKDFECQSDTTKSNSRFPLFITEWAPDNNPPKPNKYSNAMLAFAGASNGTVHLFPWTWAPSSGYNRLIGQDSDWYGSGPTAWGKSYRDWKP